MGSFNTRKIGDPSFKITNDVSTTGWRAVFNHTFTGGQFSITEILISDNTLELKAIHFGLRS